MDLQEVFASCGPDSDGFIPIEHLRSLAADHIVDADEKDIAALMQTLDLEGKGQVNYQGFCRGIAAILETTVPTRSRKDSIVSQVVLPDIIPGEDDELLSQDVFLATDIMPEASLKDGWAESKDFSDHSSDEDNGAYIIALQEELSRAREERDAEKLRTQTLKQENNSLQEKIHVLEEQLLDLETASKRDLKEEQKKSTALQARLEKIQQADNEEEQADRLQVAEETVKTLQKEAETLRNQVHTLTENCRCHKESHTAVVAALQREIHKVREQQRHQMEQLEGERLRLAEMVAELSTELQAGVADSRCRSGSLLQLPAHLTRLEEDLRRLTQENLELREAQEEAQLSRPALVAPSFTLASELDSFNKEEMQARLEEQQEVIAKLRAYIDSMLLNILERNPEMLELQTTQ